MRRNHPLKRWQVRLILFAIILCFGIRTELYISYNGLTTTEYTVQSDKITAPVTICLLADLHDHRFGKENIELVRRIEETQPDLILLAGDIVNEDSAEASAATELIPQLRNIAPVYFSLGNQERGYIRAGTSDLLKELTDAGAVVLEETFTSINVKGNRICLAGMYGYAFAFDGSGRMDKNGIDPQRLQFLERFQEQDCYKIMMAHRPDSFIFGDAGGTWMIDLVVSGHLHGGQVILPFIGGLYAGDQGLFPRYDFGEFDFQKVRKMIISRGLGSDREKLPRFNNPPEVTVITLISD